MLHDKDPPLPPILRPHILLQPDTHRSRPLGGHIHYFSPTPTDPAHYEATYIASARHPPLPPIVRPHTFVPTAVSVVTRVVITTPHPT